MLYQRKTFTCPAAPSATLDQRKWDYSVLTKAEFIAKYGYDAPEYADYETIVSE